MTTYRVLNNERLVSSTDLGPRAVAIGATVYDQYQKASDELSKFGPDFTLNIPHHCVSLDPVGDVLVFFPTEDLEAITIE